MSLGISWFVSLGDKSDISGNDLLQFWEDDESTAVIAMYTESFGNARKMVRIARRVSRRRPIVAVRTGAAAIGPAGGALYQQAGLIEVPTVAALLDTVRVLSSQPVVGGRNVAVVSNGSSAATLAMAALTAAGLRPVDPPVPLDWRATTADYRAALEAAVTDPSVDAVMVINVPPVPDPANTPAGAIHEVAEAASIPIVAVSIGRRDGPLLPGSPVPSFAFPEPAAACLGRSYAYHRWLVSDAASEDSPLGGVDREAAAGIIEQAIEQRHDELRGEAAHDLLRSYGVPVPVTVFVDAVDAPAAADAIGGHVVVKARRRHIGRSAEAGIALDLSGRIAVADAVATMRTALGDDADRVAVQQMVTPGFDVRIRVVNDPSLGPVISVGLAGFSADLITDEPTMLAPLTASRTRELLAMSRVASGLAANGIDLDEIIDVVGRCALLAADHDEIDQLDVNPAIVSANGCWVTDVRIDISPVVEPVPPMRRLP